MARHAGAFGSRRDRLRSRDRRRRRSRADGDSSRRRPHAHQARNARQRRKPACARGTGNEDRFRLDPCEASDELQSRGCDARRARRRVEGRARVPAAPRELEWAAIWEPRRERDGLRLPRADRPRRILAKLERRHDRRLGHCFERELRWVGSACIAERRAIEIADQGHAVTDYMRFGDRVRIEMLDAAAAASSARSTSVSSRLERSPATDDNAPAMGAP